MTTIYITKYIIEGNEYLEIQKTILNSNNYKYFKSSPIFPVSPKVLRPPRFNKSFYIGFFYPKNTAHLIFQILHNTKKNKLNQLWFSHGLASLIIFANEKNLIIDIWNKYQEKLHGYEIWTIKDNKIIDKDSIVNEKTASVKNDRIKYYMGRLKKYNLPYIIDEYYLISRKAIELSAQYAPVFLEELNNLDRTVLDIFSDLVFLIHGDDDEGKNIKPKLKELLKSDVFEKYKRIHQRIASIVQINAILSKVISQLFSGRIPIDKNECYLSSYSLLGIGSAYLALYSFSRYINDIFRQYPISTVVKQQFSELKGVPIYPKVYNYDDTNEWITNKPNYTHWFKSLKIEDVAPKLVYFSARQGFREATFYISAPLQVLPLCFSPQWSMLTLSHEFLHAHVDSILISLFSMNEDTIPRDSFYTEFKEFIENLEKYRETNNYGDAKLDKCCRAIIYCYLNFMICNSRYNGTILRDHTAENERKNTIIHLKEYSPENTWSFFNNYYKDIAEYCVHSLDYKYFYHNKPDIFLFSLWESWSKVPNVSERIPDYVFRCILAIASDLKGTALERINLSLNIFTDSITQINIKSKNNPIYTKIIKILANKNYINKIKNKFKPSLYLLDFFLIFFSYDGYIDRIFCDENVIKNSDGHISYAITKGEFSDVKITSPIAFIMSIFNDYYNDHKHKYSSNIERLSLWTLIMCSSTLLEDEK